MRIGYSFWGFLGPGVTDTPDGGRSHRRTLLDGIRRSGHELILLQANRDLAEAGDDFTSVYRWDRGLPDIDALVLEWRWRIPRRNDTPCGNPSHTCDLHRQDELVQHYTIRHATPTVLWDKDQRLPPDAPLRGLPHVRVCEAALFPGPGATSLLFPVADEALDQADPAALAGSVRDIPLVYIGNQYDRDAVFTTYFAPAALELRHRVAGKWPRTKSWPNVRFTGRTPFTEVAPLYRRSIATVLLAPSRYAASGQFTQRLFEAALQGCLPIAPETMRGAVRIVPPELVVAGGGDVTACVNAIRRVVGTAEHVELIRRCIGGLSVFRCSRQIHTFDQILADLSESPPTVRAQHWRRG